MDSEPVDSSAGPPRRSSAHPATVSLPDGREVRALATHLSNDGCYLVAEAGLCVGETLVVMLAGRGSIQAQVRWTAGDRAGVRFLSEDSPEQGRVRIGV
jgi:hypothetical protein